MTVAPSCLVKITAYDWKPRRLFLFLSSAPSFSVFFTSEVSRERCHTHKAAVIHKRRGRHSSLIRNDRDEQKHQHEGEGNKSRKSDSPLSLHSRYYDTRHSGGCQKRNKGKKRNILGRIIRRVRYQGENKRNHSSRHDAYPDRKREANENIVFRSFYLHNRENLQIRLCFYTSLFRGFSIYDKNFNYLASLSSVFFLPKREIFFFSSLGASFLGASSFTAGALASAAAAAAMSAILTSTLLIAPLRKRI